MISDVLSDAGKDIRDYLRRMPDVYGEWIRSDIENLLQEMDRVRRILDTPPGLLDRWKDKDTE